MPTNTSTDTRPARGPGGPGGPPPGGTGTPPAGAPHDGTPPAPNWTITGTTAGETLTGTAGNDRIYGDAGNDIINALAGDDVLDGGAGVNRLTGGAGSDLFVIAKDTATAGATTTITDFSVADHDHLALFGFGPPRLFTSAAEAQANGGVYQHVVTVSGAAALQLDVYAAGSTTAAAVVQLVGVTATQTAGDLFGGPHGGPPHA